MYFRPRKTLMHFSSEIPQMWTCAVAVVACVLRKWVGRTRLSTMHDDGEVGQETLRVMVEMVN